MINFLINSQFPNPTDKLIQVCLNDSQIDQCISFDIEAKTFELMCSVNNLNKIFTFDKQNVKYYADSLDEENFSTSYFPNKEKYKGKVEIAKKFQILSSNKTTVICQKIQPKNENFEDYCKFLFCGYPEKKQIRNSIFFSFSVISVWAKTFNLSEIEILKTIDRLSQVKDKFFVFYYFYVDKKDQKDWEKLIEKKEPELNKDPSPSLIGRAQYTFRDGKIIRMYNSSLIDRIIDNFNSKGIELNEKLELKNSPDCDKNKIIDTLSHISSKEIRLAFPNCSQSKINQNLRDLKENIKDNVKNNTKKFVLGNNEITQNYTQKFWNLYQNLAKNNNVNNCSEADFFHYFNYLTNNEQNNVKNKYKPKLIQIKSKISDFLDYIESNDALFLCIPKCDLEKKKESLYGYRKKINDDINNSFKNKKPIKKEKLAIIAFYKQYDAKQLFREFGYYDDSFRLFDILLFFMLRPEIKKLYDSQLGCYIFILIYNEIKKILE